MAASSNRRNFVALITFTHVQTFYTNLKAGSGMLLLFAECVIVLVAASWKSRTTGLWQRPLSRAPPRSTFNRHEVPNILQKGKASNPSTLVGFVVVRVLSLRMDEHDRSWPVSVSWRSQGNGAITCGTMTSLQRQIKELEFSWKFWPSGSTALTHRSFSIAHLLSCSRDMHSRLLWVHPASCPRSWRLVLQR